MDPKFSLRNKSEDVLDRRRKPLKKKFSSPLPWPLKLAEEPRPVFWAGGKKEAPTHGNPAPWPAHMVTGPSLGSAVLIALLVLCAQDPSSALGLFATDAHPRGAQK